MPTVRQFVSRRFLPRFFSGEGECTSRLKWYAMRAFVSAGAASLICLGVAQAAEEPGTIPGSFGVSHQGAAQYSIPIATPAATGGMRPNLALTYNHLAGNGLAGMRWTLTGFSSISRCQQTYAQDGAAVPTKYDSDDRFCLDGQRLVATSGTYGANNTEYRTELETFQKVKSYGTAGSGPSYFTVQHGNGLISHYGDSTDSKIEKVGSSSVRIWYLTYTEDQFGNRVNYGYDENTTTGEVVPDEVTWTSNSGQGLSARYSVTINYATRDADDQRSGYDSGGAKWAMTKRISSIEVEYNGTSEIATYDLSYSTSTTDRSQLDDVTLSRGTDSLPETAFTWQDGTVGWNNATDTNLDSGSYPLVGDFNNDGRMDIFVSLDSTWQVYQGTDDGSFEAAVDSGITYTGDVKSQALDYDGDGDTDLLYKGTTNWMVLKSDGDDFASSAIDTGISKTSPNEAYISDFDGDGLQDWLYLNSDDATWRRNTGTGFASPATLMTNIEGYVGGPSYVAPPDINGDGRREIFYIEVECIPWPPQPCDHSLRVARSLGSSYSYLDEIDEDSSYSAVYLDIRSGDINGDGLSDVFYAMSTSSNWKVALSEGTGFANPQSPSVSSANYANDVVADYNGDGLDDLLRYASGTYYVYLSTGTTISNSYTTSFAGESAIRADFDGDGYPDLAYVSGGDWQIRTHKSDLADVVTTFTNGLGYGIDVTYESLAQTAAAHYQLDATDTPTGPYVQQFSGPRYVVTHEDHDDGIGGTRDFEHKYDTAYLDRSGRGWLSFDWHRTKDLDQETYTTTWFKQNWPYSGVPSITRFRRTSDNQNISETVRTWDKTTTTSTTPDIHFIRVESTTSKNWEIEGVDDGDLVRTVVDDPTYNTTYGYVDERTITTSAPVGNDEWETDIDYDASADTDDWCLGLPGLVTTTNTLPDTTSETRKLDHVWNATNCSLTSTTDKSDTDTELQLKTSYTYDGYGNPNVVSTDSVGGAAQNRSVDFDYDSWGHFVTEETIGTVNLDITRTWDYVNAQPASVTGADGIDVDYTYDSFGRLESVDTATLDTDYTYVACTTCFPGDAVYYVKADHSDGNDEYEYFDALNRSVGSAWTLPGGAEGRKETEYNFLGQVDRVTQPFVSTETKYWVTYDYDLIGRVIEEDAPVSEGTTSGAITAYEYLGETIKVTDAEGNITQRVHNAIGQVIEVIDDLSNDADYEYAPFGELVELTDAESNVTDITYDIRGFKTQMDDPNMGVWDYEYNLYGELVAQTNALDQETTLEYDEAGRLTERDEVEGTTTWSYFTSGTGAKGKVSLISAPNSYQQDFSYYTATGLTSRTRRKIDGTWYNFDMTYDSYGRLDTLEYPTSTTGYRFEVDYDYDAYGHLSAVKDGNEAYTYYTLDETDALGREREVSLGNGRDESREYDEAAGYLLSIATDNSTQDLVFTYDEVGNVLTRYDDLIVETETFTYDDLNRLSTAQVTGESTVSLTYSAAGNVLTKTGCSGTWVYGAGSAGPFAVTTACGNTYAYDANGRMTSRAGDTITWYSYDKPKKIISGSQSAEFWYGADRSRYKQEQRTSGSLDSTIRYVSALFEFEDPESGNDLYRHYVQAGSRVVASVEREDTGSPSNVKHFLHRDNQGSVTKVTNASGNVLQAFAYDAWGLRRDATDWSALGSPFSGTHETERGYTGHEHLDNVGLIHMNGRVQDPVLGRFISPDPIIQAPNNTQSHNRYSYVWNNPASMVDPSGFCTIAHGVGGLSDCMRDIYTQFTDYVMYLQYLESQNNTDYDMQWFLEAPFDASFSIAIAHSKFADEVAQYQMLQWVMSELAPIGPSVSQDQVGVERPGAREEAERLLTEADIVLDGDWRDPDDAARYILPIIIEVTMQTGLEIGGFIYPFEARFLITNPIDFIGTTSRVPQMSPPLPGSVAGFHSHTIGLNFGAGDPVWANEYSRILYMINPERQMFYCVPSSSSCLPNGSRQPGNPLQ